MNPEKRIQFALNLLSTGKVQQAAEISSQVLADAPGMAPAHYLASEVAVAQDQLPQALEHIEKAIAIDHRQPVLLLRKAHIQVLCRQGLNAQKTASEAADRFPDDAAVQLEAASIYSECGNHEGAEALLSRAGAIDPANPRFLFEWSTNQFFLGHTDEAEKAIADFLDLDLPVKGRKLLLRAQLRKQTPENNHVDSLRKFLSRDLPETEAVNGYFALARELEDMGEYGEAFEALRSGAAIQRRLVNFSLDSELQNLNDLIETFQPDQFARITDSESVASPIFVVGMPRTGTTLVERMVAQSEGVKSAEESFDFTLAFSSVINDYIADNPGKGLSPLSAALEVDYNEIARNYLDTMEGMLGPADRFLDKTPFNFMYCGLIGKSFPRARIVHLVRQPMDTCYAVFKTLFSKAYYFSYDLEELADYYVGYRRLMSHWRKLMPDTILDVSYEELVSEPAGVSKRIADFVGIEWSERLIEVQDFRAASSTASAAQVRAPIHTRSVGLWRRYEDQLEPLRQRLLAAGVIDEKGNPLG